MLTRKHFNKLADMMASLRPREEDEDSIFFDWEDEDELLRKEAQRDLWLYIRERLATFCAEENPRFDRRKFMAACDGEI